MVKIKEDFEREGEPLADHADPLWYYFYEQKWYWYDKLAVTWAQLKQDGRL